MNRTFLSGLFSVALFLASCFSAQAQWVQTNGPYGGFVESFAALGPVLFAGTNDGLVFRSLDSGRTWRLSSNGIPENFIYALDTDAGSLFAGTPNGVYISGNGTDWYSSNTGLPNSAYITGFAVLGQDLFASSEDSGVFRSTDHGASWSSINNGLSGLALRGSSLTVLDSNLFLSTYGGGIYRSTDSGNSWMSASSGLFGNAGNIRVVVSSKDTLYAATGLGLFRSTDLGANWKGIGFTGNYTYAVLARGTTIFAGTETGIFRSSDGGTSWNAVANVDTAGASVVSFFGNGSIVLAGSAAGVFFSSDSGTTWSERNKGLTGLAMRSVASMGANLIAGTLSDGGILVSPDRGTNWFHAYYYGYVFEFSQLGTNLFAAADRHVLISTDGGLAWQSTDRGLPTADPVDAITTLDGNLFVGTIGGGIYRSSDNGLDWYSANSGLTGQEDVYELARMGKNLFAATYDGIFRSTDAGDTWTCVDANDATTYELCVSGTTVFASTEYEGIIRSTDSGVTWAPANRGLPLNSFGTYMLSADEGNIFVATYENTSGLYVSTDNGGSWKSIRENLPDEVYAMALMDSEMYVGTYNAGIWNRPISQLGLRSAVFATRVDGPGSISTFPNPAAQSTTLRYFASENGFASVVVVNQLGLEISQIYSGELATGEHSLVWNIPPGLAAGMYECIIRQNGTVMRIPVMVE